MTAKRGNVRKEKAMENKTLITVSVFVCCSATVFAQDATGSLLRQAVKGTLKPATIALASDSIILTKTAPFFSGGMLAAAQAALDSEEPSGAADFGPRTTQHSSTWNFHLVQVGAVSATATATSA